VIIARTFTEDITWLEQSLPKEWSRAIYTVDAPSGDSEFKVPKNKGHEAMVYLSYLIDHYDSLPDVMLFLHAHKIAWHNNDLLGSDATQMIASLSGPYVQRQGYANMRCHWDPGCPEWMHPFDPSNRTDISKPEERELAQAFAEIFPGRKVPETMATPCCAQFALSRKAAQRVKLSELENYRKWILDTPLPDIISGRVWEYLWHYIFTDEPVVCVPQDVCYCDGFGVCFGGTEQFDKFMDQRNEMRLLEFALDGWEKELKENKKQRTKAENSVKETVEGRIDRMRKVLDAQVKVAQERGKDPKLRAEDSGRTWKEGDGY
jgi:hypothetical protein